jgi:microcompartment protein CcmK/EutM
VNPGQPPADDEGHGTHVSGIVAAGGNRNVVGASPCFGGAVYPAAYDGVIAVASTTRDGTASSFSSPGPWIKISAPGGERSQDPSTSAILSLWPQSQCQFGGACTEYQIGTSQSAGFVSGAAALLLSVHPELAPSDVTARMTATAHDLGPPGPDPQYGAGSLDIGALVGAEPADQILAEGATGPGFDEYILLANPATATASAQVDFLTGGGVTPGPTVFVPGGQRLTIHANDYVTSYDVSARIRTFGPALAVERAMYISSDGRSGATAGRAAATPSTSWYLAEGSTQPGFEEYVLIANPSTTAVPVNVVWQTPAGPLPGPAVTVMPLSRVTVRANDTAPGQVSLSARVDAAGPVVVERSIYVTSGPLAPAATAAPGQVAPGRSAMFAEGSTLSGFDDYLLFENPGSQAAVASVQFLTPSGPDPAAVSVDVAPGGRTTLHIDDVRPGVAEIGAAVTSTVPLVVERAMYYRRPAVADGTAVGGVEEPDLRWVCAEGSTGAGFDEWVLVANSTTGTVTAATTILTPSGSRPGPTVTLNPGGRASIHVNTAVVDDSVSVVVSASAPVAVERTLFVSTSRLSGVTGSECQPWP